MMRRVAALVLGPLIAGCVEEADIPTVPEQILPMQLSTSLRDLPRGQSATLTVSLTNSLEDRVELYFPTTCQVILYIRDQGNRVVARRRTDDCARVPSLITLQPSQTTTFTFTWSGESELGPPGSGTALPAGTYYASAEMVAENYTGVAFPIIIVLLN
jgi:hypothetical protein